MSVTEQRRDTAAVEGGSNRAFGMVFTVFFAVVAVWPLVRHGLPVRWWAAGTAAAFLLASLLVPGVLAPLNRLWTAFGLLLHRVVSPVVMGILFFLVLTPIGLLLRLSGKDLLKLRRDPQGKTYWESREAPGPQPDTMKFQF